MSEPTNAGDADDAAAGAAWRSPLLDLPGAVAGPADEGLAGVPLHFGDPSGEQWALEAGLGLVDRSDLAVLTVSGADRSRWLTSITSQVLTGMDPGESRELLVLDPQGHIEHAAGAVEDGERLWLITEGDHADALSAWLDSMRFALRVEVARRDDVTVFATASPGSADPDVTAAAGRGAVVPGAGAPSSVGNLPGWVLDWDDPWPGVTEGGTEYHRGRHPGERVRMHLHVVERARAAEFARAWLSGSDEGVTARAGGGRRRAAGLLAWEAMRIAAWRPRVGRDADARAIPAEVDWLRTAVHTHKGCYRGQESVARVLNLGRPPRRLVYLQLDGSTGEVPAAGTVIERGGRRVGVITSVARHADEGPIALALVARNLPAEVVLDIEGVAAAQELIVPLDGRAADSPEERPGAGLANPALRRTDVRGSGSGGLAPAGGH